MKMMVVDDAIQICSGIKDGIDWKHNGIQEVFVAYDGLSALSLFEQQHPEIVIADIRMAGLDGIELSREILKQRKETRIILLSAYSEFEYAREALRIGVFAYELKPLKETVLACRVREAQQSWHEMTSRDDAAEQYARILREKKLAEILLGQELNEQEICDYFRKYFVILDDEAYICAVFVEIGVADGEAWLTEQLRKAGGHYLTRVQEVHVALLACTNSALYMEKVIADLQRMVGLNGTLHFCAGVSEHGKLKNVGQLYRHAREALELRFYTGESTINRWGSNVIFCQNEIPIRAEQLLCKNQSGMMEWPEVKERINEIYSEISQARPYYAPQSVRTFTMEMMHALRQEMQRLLGEDDQELVVQLRNLERNDEPIFLHTYRDAVLMQYRKIFDKYFDDTGDGLNNFAIRCKFYINGNYQKTVRVQDLAEYFRISPNYFSHLFKKTMGMPFIQYLNTVRVQQAKRLLDQGQMQAAEVARSVGFEEYKYFHQVYRKYMGCAPTKSTGSNTKL